MQEQYHSTLLLFQTDFPIRAEAHKTDKEIQNKWITIDICNAIKNQNTNSDLFFLPVGPPYANGNMHLGHAYTEVLKDIVIKSRLMMGYKVSFIPCWDCHGLPIEHKVSSQNPGISKTELVEKCRSYADHWVKTQREEFKTLGVFMDWDNTQTTMDFRYEADTIRAFGQLVKDGYITRSNKTVPWCFSCKTALATAEIEYADRKDPSIYPLFKIVNGDKIFNIQDDVYCIIWTTTPWTLPLNRAVMLKENGRYVLARCNNTYLVFGEKCLEYISKATEKQYEVLESFDANFLKGKFLHHPFDENKQVPFVFDLAVEDKEGTACVHTAPGCGPIDYEVGVKNKLEIYSPVNDSGCYSADIKPSELEGMSVTDGQIWVIKKLAEKKLLWHKTSIRHSYPHCWRCKQGLIFRATPQWFFDLTHNNLKQRTLNYINQISFFPSNGKNFLTSTIANRWEWCLSRQRSWGVPIPALIDNESHDYFVDYEMINKVADYVEKHGIEWWQKTSEEELKNLNIIPDDSKYKNYIKEDDILDVWFDSGMLHTAVSKRFNQFPASMYLEGIDQHRGWFQSSLITSVALYDTPCMKSIVTHGFTVDEKGQKMSKSLGNGVEPQEIINKIGTDGLRLWVGSVSNEGDIVVSQKVFDNVSEVYRKIRNTCRFMLQNIADFDYKKDTISYEQLSPLDQYTLRYGYEITIQCIDGYQTMQTGKVFHSLADFCSRYLSTVYFDIIKDSLYCDEQNSVKRRGIQTVLYHCLNMINTLIAPIMSHTAELIRVHYGNKDVQSIFFEPFETFKILAEVNEYYSLSHHSLINEKVIEKIDTLLTKTESIKSYNETWKKLLQLRGDVFATIEKLRNEAIVKQSVETTVKLQLDTEKDKPIINFLNNSFKNSEKINQFLIDFLLVSDIVLSYGANREIIAEKHQGIKCPRCWKYHYSQNNDTELCTRCKNNITR
jgi:isoleucyl-tRNA synthetase